MTARLGRFCARWAAVRARATVEGDASPLAEKPPPSTTATSGNPARSPSVSPVARGSDLMERAVHDHESRERVRAPRVLVNGIAIRLPASDALLVVDRVVAVALPQRDDRQQVIEGERRLGHRCLLRGRVETIA